MTFQVIRHCLLFSRNKSNYWGPCIPVNISITSTSCDSLESTSTETAQYSPFHALSLSAAALITHKPTAQTSHGQFSGSAVHLQTPNSGTDVWNESYLQSTGKGAEAEVIRWQQLHRLLTFLLIRGNGGPQPCTKRLPAFHPDSDTISRKNIPIFKASRRI